MIKLPELAEQAKEMAKIHGAKWDNSLSKYPDGTIQFEVVSSEGETIVTTGRDKNTDSWLCDYLILCSPENIIAIAKYVAELEQRLNAIAQPVSDGRTMREYEFSQLVNDLLDMPTTKNKRDKVIDTLKAFNIRPAAPGGQDA